ncbi:hypothetical protein A2801_01000 [Candidatus Woesebacteria bacterium RIFCSPHIGHO2_01_FULL_41_10]|uniref:Uncharacterized protein n=1 Tax=Candidatus Woesebacteria bacterium RIFCSPHIGHO2_01_FULL_41_10 TaxID=1802500 RepID=A0A1F7YRG1_9BACT|nr:MAG: hypothetical protein A2801_01000 [Candidatus Woesebacteria bacterium RIFCSPHIGHO2_01_FULL_41_10]
MKLNTNNLLVLILIAVVFSLLFALGLPVLNNLLNDAEHQRIVGYIEELGSDPTGKGVPADYQQTWHYCSNAPLEIRNEYFDLWIVNKGTIPSPHILFDERCDVFDADGVPGIYPASELIGLADYARMKEADIKIDTTTMVFLDFRWVTQSQLFEYVLSLRSIEKDISNDETSIEGLKVLGYVWIQFGADANEVNWRFTPVIADETRQFIILPNASAIPVTVYCPTTNTIKTQISGASLAEVTAGRFTENSGIECFMPGTETYTSVEQYFAPYGFEPTMYSGILYKRPFPF